MADFSFGAEITENAFLKHSLPAIVSHLERKAQSDGDFSLTDIHRSLKLELGTQYQGKWHPLKVFVDCAFLVVLHRLNVHEDVLCPDPDSLHLQYPQFQFRCGEEQDKLLHFRNFMALAVRYIKAKNNMEFLLTVCTRLTEGPDKHYVTGSGMTRSTADRVEIYRVEGNAPQGKRRVRAAPVEEMPSLPTLSRKRSRAHCDADMPELKRMVSGGSDWALAAAREAESPLLEFLGLLDTAEGFDSSRDVDVSDLDFLMENYDFADVPLFPAECPDLDL